MADNVFWYLNSPGNWKTRTLNNLPIKPGNAILRYPEGIGGEPYTNRSNVRGTPSQTIPFTVFMPYKRGTGTDGFYSTKQGNELYDNLPQPQYAIVLPTPSSALKTSYSADYADFEIGQALGTMADTLGSAMTSIGKLKDAVVNVAQGDAQGAASSAGQAGISGAQAVQGIAATGKATAMLAISSVLEGAGLSPEVLNVGLGQANNPYTENVFKNMSFREHSFSYVFMPRNTRESETIDQIITLFKYAMHPRPGTGIAGAGGFFDFPFEFQITHSIQDTTFTLLPSVLKSLDVDYSGGADSPKLLMPQDNKQQYPVKITVDMTFMEMVLLTRDRIWDERAPTLDIALGSEEDILPTYTKRFRF